MSQNVAHRIPKILRVNHAGEFGATFIYKGQLAVLRHKSPLSDQVEHMAAQEQEHYEKFSTVLKESGVRPTYFLPLWRMAGYAAGMGSALMGDKTAMALTAAVEEAIDEHYQGQLAELSTTAEHAALRSLIADCHEEELQHRDAAIENHAQDMPGYKVFNRAVKYLTKTAIWLSERL